MGSKTKILVNSLMACVAASIFCACSQVKSDDGQVAQDTPKIPVMSEARANSGTNRANSGTNVAEVYNPKPSHLSTLATATTFEAIGIAPRPYCERSDPSECALKILPLTAEDEWEAPDPSNPYRLVREDSAFERAIGFEDSILFPADLDPQFIAYYVPNFSLSDDVDEADFPAEVWWETALLPVSWNQTGCSGVMGIDLRRGITNHPRDSFFFVNKSGEKHIHTLVSFQPISVELTVSGYQINTNIGPTAAITITPDDEGRCVAKVRSDE